jgi:hypothetical protein
MRSVRKRFLSSIIWPLIGRQAFLPIAGASMAYDEKTAERVRAVLAGRRDVVEKKMMGGLAFMVDGGMCCSVSGRGGLLVAAEAFGAAPREPHGAPVDMGGRMMARFVCVAPEGYRTSGAIKKWVARRIDSVAAREATPPRGKKRGAAPKHRRPRAGK